MDYREEFEALMIETAALAAVTSTTDQPPISLPQAPIDLVVSILNEPGRPARNPYNFGLPNASMASITLERTKNGFDESAKIIARR